MRFTRRDIGVAVGGAALLGGFLGAMVFVIPTIIGFLEGAPSEPALLGVFLLVAIPIGAVIGLGAAAGAAIAYLIARRLGARRVATFAILMAIGSGLGAAAFILVSLPFGSAGTDWVFSAVVLFLGGSVPLAVIVPLAFLWRAGHPRAAPS